MIRHALAPVSQAAAAALNLPRTIDTGGAGVALTFDDGPHPEGTPAVLETLARAGARATFFVVGEQVQRRPALVAEIAAAGHLVAVHGYRHRLQLRLGGGEVRADIERGVEAVRDAIGIDVAWHRPPYGVYSPAGLKFVRESGLRPLLWSRWGKDWRRFTTPSRIAARATHEIGAGDVILLHDADFYSAKDSHRRTVQALKTILSRLSHNGLDTVLPD
ncbi:MAG: polysaccharide deacetylase family protein [Solirubrobacteraceae bacterium]